MRQITRRHAAGNGARPEGAARVDPPAGRRRRRVPELALGVLLVVLGALAGLLVLTSDRDRTPVVALSDAVTRGQVIEPGDLQTALVASDTGLAHLPAGDADRVVGKAALTDLAAGVLVTEEQFADPASVVDEGDGTVGLALERGQLPSLRLAPGDRVLVVTSGDEGGGGLAEEAQVVAAERFDDASSGWWVSLRAAEDSARRIAVEAAADVRMQLVLVGE